LTTKKQLKKTRRANACKLSVNNRRTARKREKDLEKKQEIRSKKWKLK